MNILTLENLNLTLGAKKILDNVNAGLEDTQRIGLLGINGAGKSTLLKVLSGDLEPDSGNIIKRRGLKVSYLPQDTLLDDSLSVLDNVSALIHGKEAHWDIAGEAKSLLAAFGIQDPAVSPRILSGGQKKRAVLAAALLTPCDLLILDEPTNHLDHEMIEYLEDWLQSFSGALILVTHDRYFLDAVTDRIWELDNARLYSYDGNYSDYLEKKQTRLDMALAAERKMAALYRQDLKWIMRGARARSTKQKAHIQRFEALRDREKIREERQAQIEGMSSRLGRKTIELDRITKAYGEKVLFRDFTYIAGKNDRIGIIGPNGCGKTTLLRVIAGLLPPDSGHGEMGTTVKIGFFSQENEGLDPGMRVIDCVKETAEFIRTGDGLVSASAMCENFLFTPEMQYTPVSKLSGGEKRRLYLLKVLMSAPNVLILDEPTNDLDIPTLQVLEDYLDRFDGIILTVSHDRYFLDRVVTKIFAFTPDGQLRPSEGGYSDYKARIEAETESNPVSGGTKVPVKAAESRSGKGEQQNPGKSGSTGRSPVSDGKPGRKKLSYMEQKEYDGLEARIDALTARSEALAAEMLSAGSDYLRCEELSGEKETVDADLEQLISRYFELQEKAEC